MFEAFGVTDRGCVRTNNEDAFLTAPDMPSEPGVSTSSAPSAASMFLRSMLNESGIVMMSR